LVFSRRVLRKIVRVSSSSSAAALSTRVFAHHFLSGEAAAMTELTIETFAAQLAMLLRDLPRGMVAELTDFAVAYWDGREVVYAFLRDDDNAKIEEEFDLTTYAWDEWHAQLIEWLEAPRFRPHNEVLDWTNRRSRGAACE
jgi:hypothetical protein